MATDEYRAYGVDADGRDVEIVLSPLSRSEMGAVVFMALAAVAFVFILGFYAGRWSRSPRGPENAGSVIHVR